MANPQACSAGLTIRELPEETLVYDLARHKAHCLNPTARLVWKLCDGSRDREQLNHDVAADLGIEDADVLVGLALEQLHKRHLLAEGDDAAHTGQPAEARHSRRDALRKLVAAMVGMPVVMSLSAPKAMAQLSRLPPGSCFTDSQCTGGQKCCTGSCTDVSSNNFNCGSCFRICNPVSERCENGRCVPRSDGGGPCSPGTCTTTADCPQGFGCFDAGTAPCSGTCIPTQG
jgi:hypothetical protein